MPPAPHPAPPSPDRPGGTVLLPATRFFVRRIALVAGQDAVAQVELALETIGPFTPGQLYYGYCPSRDATQALVFAAYFLWSWLRGGQTLPMKAWKIRLVEVTPAKALMRLILAALLVPSGISVLWSFFDKEKQFLHDRLAGTRLITGDLKGDG